MRKLTLPLALLTIIFSLGIIALGNQNNKLGDVFNTTSVTDNIFTKDTNDDETIYFILFHHLVVLREEADKASVAGELPFDFKESYKLQANFNDYQTQFLFQTAENCFNEIKPIKVEISRIVKDFRNLFPKGEVKSIEDIPTPSKELELLWKQKDEIVLKYRDILQTRLGEQKFAEFDEFVTDKIAPNVKTDIFKQNSDNQLSSPPLSSPPPFSGCYGYSLYDTDPDNPARLYMETGTALYCNLIYYYDPGIQPFLFKDGVLIDSLPRTICYECLEDYAYQPFFIGEVNKTYKILGDHYLASYHIYYSGGTPRFIDYYGMNYYQGNFPTPYNFASNPTATYVYNIYKAASTNISYTIPPPPLHLASIDRTSGVPSEESVFTAIRGTGLFGPNRSLQVSGSGVTATLANTNPNEIEVQEITINIEPNAARGERQITLRVNGVTSNPLTFTIGDNSPQITNMTPPQANTGETVSVTISGSHFGFNPLIQIAGTGIQPTITSSSPTSITALFTVLDATTAGQRGVKVKSRGYTGNGFIQTPQTSDLSNSVGFEVIAAEPRVEIPEIGSIEKGTVKTITVVIRNAPVGHTTNFKFKDQPLPPLPIFPLERTKPQDGWKTGEARFDDGTENGVRELVFSGTGEAQVEKQIKIRGWERSTSRNNIDLEARFNNDTNVKKSKDFTISSVEFVEESDCSGYDNIEFERTRIESRFLYVPRGGNNKIKAKIVPSGATGSFNLSPNSTGLSISPATVSSTNAQLFTANANTTSGLGNSNSIVVKANNTDTSTRIAESLTLWVREKKEVKIVVHKVTEQNDDVRGINANQSGVAYTFTPGLNGMIDTIAQVDDFIGTAPIGQRPPGYDNRTRRVFTGFNGVLDTQIQGDDILYSVDSPKLMSIYSPITIVGNVAPDTVCVTSGVNQFLDTVKKVDDVETQDPTGTTTLQVIIAGQNGTCNTNPNKRNIEPPNPPSVTAIQNHLNETWKDQGNVYFTVSPTVLSETVNFDLDRDGKLKYPKTGQFTEADKIDSNKVADSYNLYYIGMDIDPDTSNSILLAVSNRSTGTVRRSFFSQTGLEANTVAHEMGHLLGASLHTRLLPEYLLTLMYTTHTPNVTQCRVVDSDLFQIPNSNAF
jgi:hypothetical protein